MGKVFEKNDPRINRKGRPKKELTFSDVLKKKLKELRKVKKGNIEQEMQTIDIMMEKWIELAIAGDSKAMKDIVERLEGKAIQHIKGAVDVKNFDLQLSDEDIKEFNERMSNMFGSVDIQDDKE